MELVIDELTYRNYCYNRLTFPETAVERWQKIYGVDETQGMETRFQAAQNPHQ